jgi:hypothetical protein
MSWSIQVSAARDTWMVWLMGEADQQTWLALEMRDKGENREMLGAR